MGDMGEEEVAFLAIVWERETIGFVLGFWRQVLAAAGSVVFFFFRA